MNMLERIDILMKERNIKSRSTVADGAGIPYTTLDGLYKKGYENIRLPTLQKLANFFNVTIDYLVGNESESNKPKSPKEIFAQRIKELREEQGLKSCDIARLLGIGQSSLSQYELCQRTPNIDVCKMFADYFNVSCDYLIGRSDDR